MLAAKRCSSDAVEILINNSADTLIRDDSENTVLHWCLTERHDFDEVMKCINIIDPEKKIIFLKNSLGKTAVDYIIAMQSRWPEYNFPSNFPLKK